MEKNRLEAFSDGVLAIIITIMVLELRVPAGSDIAVLKPLLFWLSLFPFVTGWMGENHFTTVPTAVYGTVLLLAAIAYYILQSVIIAGQGCDSKLAAALFQPWISCGIYVLVALLWLVPDRRIERLLAERKD